MGNFIGRAREPEVNLKRKLDLDETESLTGFEVKRIKLHTTSQYIYNTLFVNGEGSDVTICALDHEWKLHKLYLRQAGYFSGMFQGSWKESELETIHLNIPDPNITVDSLNIAFGLLYSDDLVIASQSVVSVLAAASLIQSDGLMQKCSQVMVESICSTTVCEYYQTSRLYGQVKVEDACVSWLEDNLMVKYSNNNLIVEINPDLMTRIVKSHNLFVLQVEMDIYTLLRRWLYLRVNQTSHQVGEKSAVSSFFRDKFKESGNRYLETDDGKDYAETFRAVRYCNVIRDFMCAVEVECDGIVPGSWLFPVYRERWLSMLRVEQGIDRGPNIKPEVDGGSMRCGRILMRDVDHCWRWNGFNFAIDLLVMYNAKTPCSLSIKRNIKSQRRVAAVGLGTQRKVIYKMKIFSLDTRGHVCACTSVGPCVAALEKDEDRVVLTHDNDKQRLTFPLYVSATFRVVSTNEMINNFEIRPLSS
ncbi:germ cell-less protein-like 2 [Ciona intestinalis]